MDKIKVEEILKKAEQGDPEAQFHAGRLYSAGIHQKCNRKTAIKWWKLAADQRHAGAQNCLAGCYWNGKGIEKDQQEALRLWRLAAEQGNRGAQIRIGDCYYTGEAVEQNREEAVKWYTQANATEKLIECYRDGCRVELNIEKIIKEWEDAFERSRSHAAMLGLAHLYSDGLLMKPDYEKAAQWWHHAAEGDDGIIIHGHPEAHYELALYYQEGKGVEKNEQTAIFYFWATVASFRDMYKTCSFENEPEYVTSARRMLVKHGDADMIAKVRRAARNGSLKAKEILEEFGIEPIQRKVASEIAVAEDIVIAEEPKCEPLIELVIGEKIYHKSFGDGTVCKIDGRYAWVEFETVGKKQFVNPDAFIDGFLVKATG